MVTLTSNCPTMLAEYKSVEHKSNTSSTTQNMQHSEADQLESVGLKAPAFRWIPCACDPICISEIFCMIFTWILLEALSAAWTKTASGGS